MSQSSDDRIEPIWSKFTILIGKVKIAMGFSNDPDHGSDDSRHGVARRPTMPGSSSDSETSGRPRDLPFACRVNRLRTLASRSIEKWVSGAYFTSTITSSMSKIRALLGLMVSGRPGSGPRRRGWRDEDLELVADLHLLEDLGPAGDDAVDGELGRPAVVVGGVELGAVDEGPAVVGDHGVGQLGVLPVPVLTTLYWRPLGTSVVLGDLARLWWRRPCSSARIAAFLAACP